MKKLMIIGAALFSAQLALAAPPAWVDGKDDEYARDEYILGIGKGPKEAAAESDARAEISRVFESKVTAVMEDFQAAATKVNGSGKGVSVEVQAIAKFTQVTTQKTLAGTEIARRGKDGGTHYALAVLSRKQCINALKGEIKNIDGQIKGAVEGADGEDKLKRFKNYGKALNLMDEREGLNAMLRVCDTSGKGVPPPVALDELVSAFDEASGEFKLGVIVEGNGADKVRDCIMEQLGNKGYQITEIRIDDEEDEEEEESEDEDEDGGGGFDAILKGKLKSAKAGEIAGSVMVNTTLTLKLINGKTKKTLKTFTGSRKEGRRDVKSSAALAAHKICLKNVGDIVAAIDKYFKR